MKDARWVAVLMVLAAPAGVATAQEQRALTGGAGYGGPLGAAVMGELIYGLKVNVHEDDEQVKARAGLLLQLHAGTGGGKVSLGVGARAGVRSDDFKGSVAAGLKLSLARTWGPSAGPTDRATYLGPEIDLSAMHVGLSLGPLFRVSGPGGSAVLFSWGLGVRF
jgi:hypothetical protein